VSTTLKKAIELAKELGEEGSRFIYEEEGSIPIPDPYTILHGGFVHQERLAEYPSTEPEKKSERETESSKTKKILYGIVAGLTALAGFGAAYYFDSGFKDYTNKKLKDAYEFVFDRETYKLKRMDSDGDGVSDWEEIQRGTDPYLTPEVERQIKLKEMLRKEFYDALAEKVGKDDAELVKKNFITYTFKDGIMYSEHFAPLFLDRISYIANASEAREEIKEFIDENVDEYHHGLDIGDGDILLIMSVEFRREMKKQNTSQMHPFEKIKKALDIINETCPKEYEDIARYVNRIQLYNTQIFAGGDGEILIGRESVFYYGPYHLADGILHEMLHNKIEQTGERKRFKSLSEEHEYIGKLLWDCRDKLYKKMKEEKKIRKVKNWHEL
jgi:hypothetical protein